MTSPESFPVEDARKKFADILDGTQFRSTHAQITRRGKRAGYVVPPEWYDRAVEALARDAAPAASVSRPPAPATPQSRKPQPRQKPAPKEGRPLLEDEAATLAETARTRATEAQRLKLQQLVANTAKGYEDYAVVSSALDLGLLTHDEVYGLVGSEEKTG